MTNTNLGGVFTKDTDGNIGGGALVSTENVCGLIFDINGFENPFGQETTGEGQNATLVANTASTTIANGNVVELNSMKDVKAAGIDENVMNGLML